MTYPQAGAVCPKCGSAAAVHSIEEWATMAQANTSYEWQPGAPMPGYPGSGYPGPGYPGGPGSQPGYGSAPPPPPSAQQSGFPDPSQYQQSGFPDPSQYQQSEFPDPSRYQQSGFPDPSQQHQHQQQQQQPQQQPPQQQPASPTEPQPTQQPGYQAGPPPAQQPGYQAGPPPGYSSEPWQNQPPPRSRSWESGSDASTFEEAIGEAVLGAMTKGLGRVIGRKMRQAYNERVVPAMAARQDAMLRDRTAIAQRHPDLRACLNDQVVFLAGGTRTMPLASAMRVRTVEQSDALVAQLRG